MTITKTAKEYAGPRITTAVDYAGPKLEAARDYAAPKLEAAVDYAAPKLEAAKDVAVTKAADAMERLAPAAEALRERLAERAALTAAALQKIEPPKRKRRTLLWSLIGIAGGIGAGLLVSKKRRATSYSSDAGSVAPAWTNTPVAAADTSLISPSGTKVADTDPVDETAPAVKNRVG